MATVVHGIVQRTKGTTSFGAQIPVQEKIVEVVTASTGGGDNPVYPDGVSILKASSAACYFTIGQPQPGTHKTIILTTQSSGCTIRTNSTGAGGVYFDSTTFTMIHPSTGISVIQNWTFIAASSVLWVTQGANPYSTALGSTAFGTSS